MVGTLRPGVLSFLTRLGKHAKASELRELASTGGRPQRTVQRWLRDVEVTFYPNVRYAALGLVHVHAFIPDPNDHHFTFPYAGDARWVASAPGKRSLYLHCLVPAPHLATVTAQLERLGPCLTITTGDGWQENALAEGTPRTSSTPLPHLTHAVPIPLARGYPLIIPVATELFARRATMPELWHTLYERVGERIWSYLPPRTRRWPRNGKAYVKHAFKLLNSYGLVQQHIVRVGQDGAIECFFVVGSVADLEALRAHAPLLEYFPGNTEVLVRAQGNIELLKAILHCDAVRAWWLARNDIARCPRIQVERLFDPRAGDWLAAEEHLRGGQRAAYAWRAPHK